MRVNPAVQPVTRLAEVEAEIPAEATGARPAPVRPSGYARR